MPSQSRSFAVISCGTLQSGQRFLTNRCAITPIKLEASKKGSTPISRKRVIAPIALLVCNVDNTTDLLKPISTATQNALDALKIPIFKANFAALPSTGNPGVIYTTEDDDKMFVWDTATSAYQEASAGGGGGTTLGGVNFFNAGDIPNSSWLAYTILEEDLTLTANVPESRGYCGFNPTATITLNVDKHVSGTFTNIGTVTISSAGVITWVGFAAQTLVEGTALRVTSPADTLGATDLFLTIAGSMPLPS